jgi:uncharacterized protein (TIGR03067 family)
MSIMRKIMGRSVVFCLGLFLTSAPVRADDPEAKAVRVVPAQEYADKGIKELQGKWRAVEMQTAGISAPMEVLEKARLEIKGNEWIWLSGGPVNGKARIKVDPSKSPKEIDLTILEGESKGSTIPGIYALEKGQLRICYSHTKDRPKDFRTKRGELRELLALERVTPK